MEIPPEVPAATTRPVVIRRGEVRLRVPSSVAQVSAVTVASAPMNMANHPSHGARLLARARLADTLPFASTCARSRRLPFSDASAALRLSASRKRERALEVTKNRIRRTPHVHPPKLNVIAPIMIAPVAPDTLSDPRQNAMPAIIELTAKARE